MKKEIIKKLLMKTIREHLTIGKFLEKPTIAELEKILNSPDEERKIILNPDGSIGTKEIVTSGTLAEAILSMFDLKLKKKGLTNDPR